MNYKIEGALRKNKKTFIFAAILWLFLAIVFVMPIACGWEVANAGEKFSMNTFTATVGERVAQPFLNIKELGSYWGSFISLLWKYTLGFLGIIVIGLVRTAPKTKYQDIEHGSSDWCEHGEQFRVLSPKKGLILAEGNYLPVDKRGNVNILVVGRIRCW
ncbi:MAG: hypothetical protein HFJ18_02430 [Clostridia bacterium]|nr:hypothetical protein [Clostridia bacterium]